MEARPYTGFYARLLGGFSLSYEGKPIQIDVSPRSKYMQIFLILLQAGSDGVEGKQIREMIGMEGETPERIQANFRQLLHTLRKVIARSGFPAGRYIQSKKKKYFFSLEHEVHVDTQELDQIILQIRRIPREEADLRMLCLDYCKCYKGEFLPMLNGEEWVTAEGAYYQKWYNRCLEQLSRILKRDGEYDTLLELSTAASRIHPYDEWQKVQIECLIVMNRHKEALRIYEEASELFYQELGVFPMDQVICTGKNEGSRIAYMEQTLSKVKRRLREPEEPKGPYHCSYPSFQDAYHVIARLEERNRMECVLLVCTLKEIDGEETNTLEGKPAKSENMTGFASQEAKMEQKMKTLEELLKRELRTGDVYTRYSKNQYLALLSSTGQEKGKMATQRLNAQWKKNSGSLGTHLEMAVSPLQNPIKDRAEVEQNGEKEDIRGTYSQSGKFHLAGTGHMAGRKGNEEFPKSAGINQAVGYSP